VPQEESVIAPSSDQSMIGARWMTLKPGEVCPDLNREQYLEMSRQMVLASRKKEID
jgi:hypothetical protein